MSLPTSRQRQVFHLYKSGLNAKSIATQLGITTARVHQLINIALQRFKQSAIPLSIEALPTRAQNALFNAGFKKTDTASEVAPHWDRIVKGSRCKGKQRIPNLGKKSLQEIEQWLKDNGHHKDNCCPMCGQKLPNVKERAPSRQAFDV